MIDMGNGSGTNDGSDSDDSTAITERRKRNMAKTTLQEVKARMKEMKDRKAADLAEIHDRQGEAVEWLAAAEQAEHDADQAAVMVQSGPGRIPEMRGAGCTYF